MVRDRSKIHIPRRKSKTTERKSSSKCVYRTDDEIGRSIPFMFMKFWYYFVYWFNGFAFEGVEKLPKNGCLLIGYHSTHNFDILAATAGLYLHTGRVARGLYHRLVAYLPSSFGVECFGGVPGYRDTAQALVNSGFIVGVIPGGAKEAFTGFENAYRLKWNTKGIGRIAKETGCQIHIIFCSNVEEMRWNPLHWIGNKIQFRRIFDWVSSLPYIGNSLYSIGCALWVVTTWFAIPIPVQSTVYISDPLDYDPDLDTVEEIVTKARDALQAEINRHQPNGLSYTRALQQRFGCAAVASTGKH